MLPAKRLAGYPGPRPKKGPPALRIGVKSLGLEGLNSPKDKRSAGYPCPRPKKGPPALRIGVKSLGLEGLNSPKDNYLVHQPGWKLEKHVCPVAGHKPDPPGLRVAFATSVSATQSCQRNSNPKIWLPQSKQRTLDWD